ncbi:hypothetical protein [Oceanobacter mangrovi]|uniref:hypothetical protein n=1 Tax=Oceanobacter mangrovi TaxID=2862510 RepID=UPI001C8EC120|nr:hypothetical protein [Oceanobacter mangrovi]
MKSQITDFCSWHPLTGALYHCPECDSELCEHCVDDRQYQNGGELVCGNCGSHILYAGVPVDVEPFWRRIDKSFRYPLRLPVLLLLIVSAVITEILRSYSPVLQGLGSVLLAAVFFKYWFTCLTDTAQGEMEAPPVLSAFSGSMSLFFRLILLFVAFGAAYGGLAALAAPYHELVSALIVLIVPACLINFGMTDRFTAALNPWMAIKLITRLGLQYWLLLGLILVMYGSVEFLSGLLQEQQTLFMPLADFISNYYMMVLFHLMGYMIYQNQRVLGIAGTIEPSFDLQRTNRQLQMDRLRILLLSARWQDADRLLGQLLGELPGDPELQNLRYRLLLGTLPGKLLEAKQQKITLPLQEAQQILDQYLLFTGSRAVEQMLSPHKDILAIWASYLPASGKLRLMLAHGWFQQGDFKRALALLNGFHKLKASKSSVLEAYHLMQQVLHNMPGMERQAQQCHRFIQQLSAMQGTTGSAR